MPFPTSHAQGNQENLGLGLGLGLGLAREKREETDTHGRDTVGGCISFCCPIVQKCRRSQLQRDIGPAPIQLYDVHSALPTHASRLAYHTIPWHTMARLQPAGHCHTTTSSTYLAPERQHNLFSILLCSSHGFCKARSKFEICGGTAAIFLARSSQSTPTRTHMSTQARRNVRAHV